jgi:hypothetical protein
MQGTSYLDELFILHVRIQIRLALLTFNHTCIIPLPQTTTKLRRENKRIVWTYSKKVV